MKRGFIFLLFSFFICGLIWSQLEDSGHREALRQLSLRAEEGDSVALYQLARLHDTGYDSIAVDSLRSSALYLISARKGYAPARNFIGFRYYKGEALNKDIDSALYWIRLAADEGDITAAANLGYLLLDSDDIPHDTVEGARWIEIAARAGVREAQIKFVELNRDNWKTLPPDSALHLGVEFYTRNTPITGVALLEIAAEARIPRALALLGDAYSKGLGVPYSHQLSLDYFHQAARLGDPSAQFIVAELLDIFPEADFSDKDSGEEVSGEDSGEPEESAAFWYEKAAAQGVTSSEEAYSRLFEY